MPLSQKQCEYLALAWQCMESEPKIDYEKFREIAGLASAHSARELLRVTKKKLREEYGAPSATAGKTNGHESSAPSTPSGKKTAAPKGLKSATPKKRGRPALNGGAAGVGAGRSVCSSTSSSSAVPSIVTSGSIDERDDERHSHDLAYAGAKRIKETVGPVRVKSEFTLDDSDGFDASMPFE